MIQPPYAKIVSIMRWSKGRTLVIVTIAMVAFSPVYYAGAQSASSNFRVDESAFSVGSEVDANSASYNSRVSAGNLGVGNSESTNFQTFAGYITPDEEYVELVIPSSIVDLGTISPGTTGTGSATFSARAYLNNQYIIVSPRNPPTSEGGEQIDPITTAAASNTGLEQFGMNLVANTSPVVQGADPAPQPNAAFAYGEAATGYDTADLYQYNAFDTIAKSDTRGYGETNYTISYVMNITPVTPAGQYTMEQDLVIMAAF